MHLYWLRRTSETVAAKLYKVKRKCSLFASEMPQIFVSFALWRCSMCLMASSTHHFKNEAVPSPFSECSATDSEPEVL